MLKVLDKTGDFNPVAQLLALGASFLSLLIHTQVGRLCTLVSLEFPMDQYNRITHKKTYTS